MAILNDLSKVLLTALTIKFMFELFATFEAIGRLFARVTRRQIGAIACFHYTYPRARTLIRDSESCPICLCQRTDAVLQCGHSYHWNCVHVWLDAHNTCPVCRTHQRRLKEPLLL